MAVVGGTTSELSGGKFANGVVTGPFVHLFNTEAENMWKNYSDSMPVALGSREGPETQLGKAIANGIDKGIQGIWAGLIATRNLAGGLLTGLVSGTGGVIQSYANKSGLKIDSVDKVGVIKVIVRENKDKF